jgi:hypothetical protein
LTVMHTTEIRNLPRVIVPERCIEAWQNCYKNF